MVFDPKLPDFQPANANEPVSEPAHTSLSAQKEREAAHAEILAMLDVLYQASRKSWKGVARRVNRERSAISHWRNGEYKNSENVKEQLTAALARIDAPDHTVHMRRQEEEALPVLEIRGLYEDAMDLHRFGMAAKANRTLACVIQWCRDRRRIKQFKEHVPKFFAIEASAEVAMKNLGAAGTLFGEAARAMTKADRPQDALRYELAKYFIENKSAWLGVKGGALTEYQRDGEVRERLEVIKNQSVEHIESDRALAIQRYGVILMSCSILNDHVGFKHWLENMSVAKVNDQLLFPTAAEVDRAAKRECSANADGEYDRALVWLERRSKGA